MRLINVYTLEMEEFVADPPRYAILSHRWIGREITYEEYQDLLKRTGPGYEKVVDFCKTVRDDKTFQMIVGKLTESNPDLFQARPYSNGHEMSKLEDTQKRAIHWIWIDTCCIDKRSSAELSESINSMWKYYADSAICVAYLFDVGGRQDICNSEWFSRGWTLQELLAPPRILFYNRQWTFLGTKIICDNHDQTREIESAHGICHCLTEATGIDHIYLHYPRRACVAQRMSWASRRRTTRKEDEAYSLFGLFDVNLPLLYGEGARALLRLQQEIAQRSGDESIFAWQIPRDPTPIESFSSSGLFAPSLAMFRDSNQIINLPSYTKQRFLVTGQGVEIEALMAEVPYYNSRQQEWSVLLLNCAMHVADQKAPSQCGIVCGKTVGHAPYLRVHPSTAGLEGGLDQIIAETFKTFNGKARYHMKKIYITESVGAGQPFRRYHKLTKHHSILL